jgi:hypothetical protein
MKRTIGSLIGVAVLLLLLAGCNPFRQMQYNLSVTVEDGVKGTPTSGVQALDELTEVEYNYYPENVLHTVEALIDGAQLVAGATITIYKDTTLVARLVDIRGAWTMTSTDANGVKTTFTVTFSGPDVLGGTFIDDQGHAGTWTGPSNKVTITYGNWEAYVYTGELFSMLGTYANGSASGTWSASRAE